MSYHLFKIGQNRIVYQLNTFGKETIQLNNKTVLEGRLNQTGKSNNYKLELIDNDDMITTTITSSINQDSQIIVDCYQNEILTHSNVKLKRGKFKNKFKVDGLAKLEAFDLEAAIVSLHKALELIPYDGEIYFHLACAYSIQEKTKDGLECIRLAMENGFADKTLLMNHDKLAFLRMQDDFKSLFPK